MGKVALPGDPPRARPESITVDHPIFGEIAQAITELFNRTQVIALTLAEVASILKAEGLLEDNEEGPNEAPEGKRDDGDSAEAFQVGPPPK